MRRVLAAVAVLVLALAACGEDGSGSVTVFAAASLTDVFGEMADAFAADNPGSSITTSFAGSSSLREQILEGAPADVFASANPEIMEDLVAAGAVDGVESFATNALQIVVPAGNPAGITGLDDFADGSLLLGLCAVEVPCGGFARQAFAAAGVDPAPDTEEPDVRALLTKVEAGELDAGIVYRTDVISAGDGVEGIDLPAGMDVEAVYPIGAVSSSADPVTAQAFIDFVTGDEGRAILREYGFGTP